MENRTIAAARTAPDNCSRQYRDCGIARQLFTVLTGGFYCTSWRSCSSCWCSGRCNTSSGQALPACTSVEACRNTSPRRGKNWRHAGLWKPRCTSPVIASPAVWVIGRLRLRVRATTQAIRLMARTRSRNNAVNIVPFPSHRVRPRQPGPAVRGTVCSATNQTCISLVESHCSREGHWCRRRHWRPATGRLAAASSRMIWCACSGRGNLHGNLFSPAGEPRDGSGHLGDVGGHRDADRRGS